MRREGKEVHLGSLAEYDLVRNFAGIFHRKLKSVPHGEVCVVGRNVSGDLTAKSVELSGDLRVYKDDKDFDSKTSKVHLHDNKAILFCLIYFMLCRQ